MVVRELATRASPSHTFANASVGYHHEVERTRANGAGSGARTRRGLIGVGVNQDPEHVAVLLAPYLSWSVRNA